MAIAKSSNVHMINHTGQRVYYKYPLFNVVWYLFVHCFKY